MAPRVVFYDIPPEQRLELVSKLAAVAWERRRPMLIRSQVEDLPEVDEYLWTFQEASFLPHEVVHPNRPLQDEEACVLLCAHDLKLSKPDILLELTPSDLGFAQLFPTVIHLIDHRHPQRLSDSRARYKAWVELGIKPEVRKTL